MAKFPLAFSGGCVSARWEGEAVRGETREKLRPHDGLDGVGGKLGAHVELAAAARRATKSAKPARRFGRAVVAARRQHQCGPEVFIAFARPRHELVNGDARVRLSRMRAASPAPGW